MQTKRHIHVEVIILLLFCGVAFAQPATQPSDRRDGRRGAAIVERVEQAMQDLGLSDEQKTQVREILEMTRAEVREVMQELRDLDPQERRQRIREMTEQLNDEIMGLLDEDQKTAFREKIDALRERAGQFAREARQPGTQPAGRVGAMVEQLRDAIEQLQLSDDQKAKAEQVLGDMRIKLRILREEAAGDMEQIRDKAREIFNDTRQDLQEMLTPEQQQKLRELMENVRGRSPRRGDSPDQQNRPERPAPAPPPMQDDQDTDKPAAPPPDAPRAALPPPVNLQPGQAAPKFALTKLDGKPVQLSSFEGRILVLIFGNYSSPNFRELAPDLEQLRRQFANRADFLIVYTRESHAVGEWEVERNRDAKIAVEQPGSLDERKALAQLAKIALKITLPIAIDTMDDKTAGEYGGFTTSAVVIGRDGKVESQNKWADPYALRRSIEDAIGARPSSQPGKS